MVDFPNIVDARIIVMMILCAIAAVSSPMWRRTAVLMFALASLNLLIDPILDFKDPENPFILGMFNFLGGFLIMTYGSKGSWDMRVLTWFVAGVFFVAALIEIMHYHDVHTDTFMVYINYKWMMLILDITQYALVGGGVYYGRPYSKNSHNERLARHWRLETDR